MHPSEMKNFALVAAARAEQDGFVETAKALLLLAEVCAGDARELVREVVGDRPIEAQRTPSGRVRMSMVSH
jgi:hypothetical protein